MSDPRWPALPYSEWRDTYATLHMWLQMAGKVALATAPPINHGWGIAMLVTPRGFSTHALPHGGRTFTIEFDFIDHQVVVRTSDGQVRTLALEPMAVADFHREFMALLAKAGLPIRIWPMPVEIAEPVRFSDDTQHHSYNREHAHRAWSIFASVACVFSATRTSFIGKCSPVHFFWGSFDLAVTRFSGRRAPDREGPAFMREAYSHEVISHGFWPGNAQLPDAHFYAYAAPEPPGLKEAAAQPAATRYNRELGEFLLPYEAVRTSPDPEAAIRAFVESTYAQAATLGRWDRAALERSLTAP